MFYSLGKDRPEPPFWLHSIAVIGPVALFYMLFNRLVLSDIEATNQLAAEVARFNALSPAEKQKELAEREASAKRYKEIQSQVSYGGIVPALVCPHCQTKGKVRRTERTRVDKTRVNSVAGRAIGLGTNTERKVVQMRCDNCGTQWDV
jgi:hypothetical protein